jgi:transcriptional regulator with XRE-family HTH domain
MTTVSETLRRAIERSGQSRYAISRATGVPESVLSRFASGDRGLTTPTVDKLCKYLGLELVPKRKGR